MEEKDLKERAKEILAKYPNSNQEYADRLVSGAFVIYENPEVKDHIFLYVADRRIVEIRGYLGEPTVYFYGQFHTEKAGAAFTHLACDYVAGFLNEKFEDAFENVRQSYNATKYSDVIETYQKTYKHLDDVIVKIIENFGVNKNLQQGKKGPEVLE